MRRLAPALAFALAAVPVCVRAAFGPAYGGEAIVAVASLADSFEPTRPADAAHRLALGLVHETLIRIGPDGRPAPGLARASATSSFTDFTGSDGWTINTSGETDARVTGWRSFTGSYCIFLYTTTSAATSIEALTSTV